MEKQSSKNEEDFSRISILVQKHIDEMEQLEGKWKIEIEEAKDCQVRFYFILLCLVNPDFFFLCNSFTAVRGNITDTWCRRRNFVTLSSHLPKRRK